MRSMVAEFASSIGSAGLADDLGEFDVDTQNICRTFTEKLLAAHTAYESNYAAQKARHYYDLYELCGLEEVKKFVGTTEYRQTLLEAKEVTQEHFPGAATPVGESLADCAAFAPSGNALRQLDRNYRREMQVLFLSDEPPTLSDVIARIGGLLSKL